MKLIKTVAIAAGLVVMAGAVKASDARLLANSDKMVRHLGAIAKANADSAKSIRELGENMKDLSDKVNKLNNLVRNGPIDGGSMRANLITRYDLPFQFVSGQNPVNRYVGQQTPDGKTMVWMGENSPTKRLIKYLNQYCGVFGKQYKAMYASNFGAVTVKDCKSDSGDGQKWCYLRDMFGKPMSTPVHVDKVVCEYKLTTSNFVGN